MAKGTKKPGEGGAYEVGYGKPPAETRFKKGQSGNSTGRPRAPRTFKQDFDDLLSRKITVRTATDAKKVKTMTAVLMRAVEEALKGRFGPLIALMKLLGYTAEEMRIAVTDTKEYKWLEVERDFWKNIDPVDRML